jgi:putative DNA primase/helicase
MNRASLDTLRRLAPEVAGTFLSDRLWGPPNQRLSHRRELRWGRRGSRVLWLAGRRAGRWRDFESGEGGDLLDAVMTTTGCRFPEALRLLGEEGLPLRWEQPGSDDLEPGHRHACRRILAHCRPVHGTPAETYLAGRGLVLGAGDDQDLRFHPALRHPGGGVWPALVALVRDPAGRLLGLHRLWLTPDGAKAPVEPVRASLRSAATMAGGCVRFGPARGELEAVAEGIETALSLRGALPGLAVCAVLGSGGLACWHPGPATRRVLLCPDRDRAGLRAAQRCGPRLHRAGIEVRLALPPRQGEDFNDLLRRAGPAAVRERLLAALGG